MSSLPYSCKNLQVLRTSEFDAWLAKQSPKTRLILLARLNMITQGHFGDHKRFEGLIELRWKNGTRVYSFMWGDAIVIALNGGNKNGIHWWGRKEFDFLSAVGLDDKL